nr:reverse transcriptase domain-containing protein [Tanacetum cinerariifolium]
MGQGGRYGNGFARGPFAPTLFAQTTPSSVFIKENIDMLRTMIKEHDQHTKTKVTSKKLTYVDSKEEGLEISKTKGLSERSFDGSSKTARTRNKARSLGKSQRSLSRSKTSSHLRRYERLGKKSRSKEKAKEERAKSRSRRHPKLAKKLNDKILKTVDKMFKSVRVFIKGKVAAGSTTVARAPQGHNTKDCYHQKKQIEEAVASRKLTYLVKDIRQGNQRNRDQGKGNVKVMNMVGSAGNRKRPHEMKEPRVMKEITSLMIPCPEQPRVYSDLSPKEKDRNQATVQDGRVVVQNVQGRLNRGQGNNPRGGGGQDNVTNKDVDEQPVQDLALNVDNVFQADDYDAFDSDVDEAPTTQTMFMANLSSADPVYDEAGPSYDSDILSEYVKDNATPGVQSNVYYVPNDAYMTIYNDMYEPHAQSVSKTSRNTVVDNSLTAKLATYKKQVELYERRARKRITPTGVTERERGFEQTKECYLKEVIPFFKTLKENFEGIQKVLTNEIKEMKDVFEKLEAEVAQNVVDRTHDEIKQINLLIANDNLIAECLSKEVFYLATNSELNVSRFTKMHVVNTILEARYLELKSELSNLRDKSHNDNHNELVNRFSNLEVKESSRKGQNRIKTGQKQEAWLKKAQEKDKIGSKPDKNEKRIERCASWDLDNSTWGGWGKGLGTVPANAGVLYGAVGEKGFWREN